MKIMLLIKITCPLKDGIEPPAFPPTFRRAFLENFLKYSEPYFYHKPQNLKNDSMHHDSVLLFDSEEELITWANNCRLTDPQLIADQETWNREYGITFIYEYYSLSPTTGPDPLI